MKNISNYQGRIKSAGEDSLNERESSPPFLDRLVLYSVGVIFATVVALSPYFYHEARRGQALTRNGCQWEETIASENSHYRKWAVNAIEGSRDLGRILGVDEVQDMLKDKNEGRKIVPGEKFSTLKCGCK